MNERADIRMDATSFLAWVQGREGRFELHRGRVVVQAGGTKRHSWITSSFIVAVSRQLDRAEWAVSAADLAVEIGDDIRYPDVVVERRSDDGAATSSDRPVILVEVLSPSSAATDLVVKLAEYTRLPSLETYIVASQDEPIAWVWERDADGTFPRLPVEIKGADGAIPCSGRGITLPMADIYRGIGTGSAS